MFAQLAMARGRCAVPVQRHLFATLHEASADTRTIRKCGTRSATRNTTGGWGGSGRSRIGGGALLRSRDRARLGVHSRIHPRDLDGVSLRDGERAPLSRGLSRAEPDGCRMRMACGWSSGLRDPAQARSAGDEKDARHGIAGLAAARGPWNRRVGRFRTDARRDWHACSLGKPMRISAFPPTRPCVTDDWRYSLTLRGHLREALGVQRDGGLMAMARLAGVVPSRRRTASSSREICERSWLRARARSASGE